MLESVAATLLNRLLGSYIQNFDPNQLNVGIWSGDVKLNDLKLKNDCLDTLDLPLDLVQGVLGNLTLNVPWSALKNKPVKIIINDCFLVCKPNHFYDGKNMDALLTNPDFIKRQFNLKLKKLMQWELSKEALLYENNDNNLDDDDFATTNSTFMQSLITKIIDNLQISITNIHLRFEDTNQILTKYNSSIGIIINELSAASANDKWQQSFIDIANTVTHKLINLNGLSIYWDTDSTNSLTNIADTENFKNNMRNFISSNALDQDSHVQFILQPITTNCKLKINKLGTTKKLPHITIDLVCDKFGLELNNLQYVDLLNIVSNIHSQNKKRQQFEKLNKFSEPSFERPNFQVDESPTLWFKHLAEYVKSEVHFKREQWSWEKIYIKCKQRKEYIDLWTQKLKLPSINDPLPKQEDDLILDQLHHELPFELITLFRMFAKRQFAKERLAISQTKEQTETNKEDRDTGKNQSAGWLSSWWNSGNNSNDSNNLILTEDEKNELYKTIEFNELEIKQTTNSNIDKDLISLKVNGVLQNGFLKITDKINDFTLNETYYSDCKVEFNKRLDSYILAFKLMDFTVRDNSPNTLYKNILTSRKISTNIIDIDAIVNGIDTGDDEDLPLIDFFYESNPIDNLVDARLIFKLLGTTIYYSVDFITRLINFFKPKDQHKETIQAILNAAEATVENWSTQSRMGLESILENHKILDLNLDLRAPLIILPTNPSTWDSSCAVIDAGHISVSSQVISRDEVEKIKSLSVEEYNKIDNKEINRLMFDRFKIVLQDTQLLVGPNIENTLSTVNTDLSENRFCILTKTRLEAMIDVLILTKAFKLPKLRIFGNLPQLMLSMSDYQYKVIMELTQNIFPQLDEPLLNFDTLDNSSELVAVEQKRLENLRQMIEDSSDLELSQRAIEINLEVEKIHFSLLKCTNPDIMECEELVTLRGDIFKLAFSKTIKSMSLNISVYSIVLEDLIDDTAPADLQYMIKSDKSSGKDLVVLDYDRRQRIVSHDNSLIEVNDQDLSINMSKLSLVVSPKSLLTLLNYVLLTFTNQDLEPLPSDILKHNEEGREDSPQKITIDIKMEGISILFKDEHCKLATLDLSKGYFTGNFLPTRMYFSLKLDGLDLTDEILNQSDSSSQLRRLMTMNGKQLLELEYETFDAKTNKLDYDSRLKCNTGAMFVNFNESTINQIIKYGFRFSKMKTYFDTIRSSAYNQVPAIDTVKNMKLDLIIRSPIIQFPRQNRDFENSFDVIKFYLGELYVENKILDTSPTSKINAVRVGLRDGNISSALKLENGSEQKLYLTDKMSILFDISHDLLASDPHFVIKGVLEDLALKVTELQLQYIFEILGSIKNTLRIDRSDITEPLSDQNDSTNTSTDLSSTTDEITQSNSPNVEKTISYDATFKAPTIALTIYDNTSKVIDVEGSSVTRLTFQEIDCDYHAKEDGTTSGDIQISAFQIEDTRNIKDNKYTKLIPKIEKDKEQFSISISQKMVDAGLLTSIFVNVNSPRFILAMDHLMAVKKFYDVVMAPKTHLKTEENVKIKPAKNIEEREEHTYRLLQYSLNVVDAAVLLLADPSDINTEAVVFSVGQFLFTEQNIFTATANNVGIFLTKMKANDDYKIRLLDDFSSSITIDKRNSTVDKLLSELHASVEPIIMRISLRDIRLAMLIFNKAVKLFNEYGKKFDIPKVEDNENRYMFSKEFEKQMKKYVSNVNVNVNETVSSLESSMSLLNETGIILKGETMTADFGGFRIILLGDIHEMPLLDINVDPFTVAAKNWSSNLDSSTDITTYVNIFNYSRSSWEALIEPTNIDFHLSKGPTNSDALTLNITTTNRTEVTLSSRSIATLSNIPVFLTRELVLTPRGSKKPYSLINETGLSLAIWIKGSDENEKRNFTVLANNSEIPWEFEDWRMIRERLGTDHSSNILQVCVHESVYKTILTIDATNEGDDVYALSPAVSNVHRRLVCDLRCNEEGVKVIKFRSTLLLENTTDMDLDVKVECNENLTPVILSFKPSESRSVPVEYAYSSKLRFRPVVAGKKYDWSTEQIIWNDLLSASASVKCNSPDKSSDEFYFELNSKYDEREPLSKIYPHMKIIISPCLIIENMLPCDLNYYVFNQRNKSKAMKLLKQSQKVKVHNSSLDDYLLLSLRLLLDGLPISESTVINTPKNTRLKPEETISLFSENGQKMNLKVKYQNVEGCRTKILQIYSPYIIINKSGRDLYVESQKFSVYQSSLIIENNKHFALPLMFSFPTESKNSRARIKFKDTEWSNPISFDAIGQSFDSTLNVIDKTQECNLGIDIMEGLGSYHLSKIVTIAPRYIVQNNLDIVIDVSELGSDEFIRIEPGKALPLYKMRNTVNKKLMIKTLGSNSEWSAPFYLKDIGLTYVKLLTENGTHMLLKLEIILQNATIFVKVEVAKNVWPFSIRNFSDYEFIFYQRDIRQVDNEPSNNKTVLEESDVDVEYKPLYYRVPPRSVMPYAWDYPTAKEKRLILTSHGRKREVQLGEIGNLKPMRLPNYKNNGASNIVDLNVIADGPTQALMITNYDAKLSLYKLREQNNNASSRSLPETASSTDKFEIKHTEDEKINNKLMLHIKGVGISLINTRLQELMYISMDGLELRYNDSDIYKTLSWKIKWLQIDNQLYDASYPNLLYPVTVMRQSDDLNKHPVISGSISKVNDDSYGLPYFKHATLLIQEFGIQFDEQFIYYLVDFIKFPGASWNSNEANDAMKLVTDSSMLPKLEEVSFINDIYFETFHLQPTLLHISFMRSDNINNSTKIALETPEITNAITSMYFLNMITMTIGNINDAPIKLNSLLLDNVKVPMNVLYQSIKTHYSQQFLFQLHMILGSADFLGNPVGLFNTISSGVWDLFYEPYQGYLLNDRPSEIGINIAKGGASFAKKTVFGISDSMSKFTGSMAKGLSFTQDKQFQETRRLQQRIAQTADNSIGLSAASFINTLGSGITGLALDPIRGSQEEGAAGFFKGIGKGIVGLPTKTMIGVFDLTNNISQSVKQSTNAISDKNIYSQRVRIPRYIDSQEQIIKPYKLRESQGQYWLKMSNGGIYNNDNYLAHIILPDNELTVIVSMERITEIKITNMEVIWAVTYNTIQGISVENDGIVLKLKSQSEYFIPIPNPQEKKYFYKHIKTAVLQFNKYCEAQL